MAFFKRIGVVVLFLCCIAMQAQAMEECNDVYLKVLTTFQKVEKELNACEEMLNTFDKNFESVVKNHWQFNNFLVDLNQLQAQCSYVFSLIHHADLLIDSQLETTSGLALYQRFNQRLEHFHGRYQDQCSMLVAFTDLFCEVFETFLNQNDLSTPSHDQSLMNFKVSHKKGSQFNEALIEGEYENYPELGNIEPYQAFYGFDEQRFDETPAPDLIEVTPAMKTPYGK